MTDEVSMYRLATSLPVIILTRAKGQQGNEWQDFDEGPGIFNLPDSQEIAIRIKNIGDAEVKVLADELADCPGIVELNLSENRSITNTALEIIPAFKYLTGLNLSSCGITNSALEHLKRFPRLKRLNLSYCNRLTDDGMKTIKALNRLEYLDLQGCVKITTGGLSKIRRRELTVHK